MEKLLLLVHGKPITDQEGEINVGSEHRLRTEAKKARYVAGKATDGAMATAAREARRT